MMVQRIAGEQDGLILWHACLDQRVGLGADLFVVAVVDALVEKEREDVAPELGMVGVATQDIGGGIKVGFKLTLRHPARRADDNWRFERFQQLF